MALLLYPDSFMTHLLRMKIDNQIKVETNHSSLFIYWHQLHMYRRWNVLVVIETFMFVEEMCRFIGERTNPLKWTCERTNPIKWTQYFTTTLMSKLHWAFRADSRPLNQLQRQKGKKVDNHDTTFTLNSYSISTTIHYFILIFRVLL
jgi:hypothetical protein